MPVSNPQEITLRSESETYVLRCLNPVFLWHAVAATVSRAGLSCAVRLGPNAISILQPPAIRSLRRRVIDLRLSQTAPPEGGPEVAVLQLAVGTHVIRADSDWSVSFADEEETASLHRWNWLLRTAPEEATPFPQQLGLSLMRSWMRWNLSADVQHDAYTVGERIVNATIFLRLGGEESLPQDVAEALQTMGQGVAKQLEYYPGELTGNHAFNNSRALFFAGAAAGLPGARDLAFAVASERLPQLVTADGFLREGSSHYHFLFTRWVLEMLWLAHEVEDQSFIELLSPYATRLVQRCWFFLVFQESTSSWQIPIVGDLSPDCPPSWLLSLPWSVLACAAHRPPLLPEPPQNPGWAGLFGLQAGDAKGRKPATEEYPDSGWLRVCHDPWIVFIHAESTNGRLRAGHGHGDLASFVLFLAGRPLIIDAGRKDYTGSDVSRYGISPRAHNTVILDGNGPISSLRWVAPSFRAVNVHCSVHPHEDETVINISHDGFARLSADRVLHRRSLRLTHSRVGITDEIEGLGVHTVNLRFHFAPDLRLASRSEGPFCDPNASLVFDTDGRLAARSEMGATRDPVGGVRSVAYGQIEDCQTIDLSGVLECPVTLSHTLSLEDR